METKKALYDAFKVKLDTCSGNRLYFTSTHHPKKLLLFVRARPQIFYTNYCFTQSADPQIFKANYSLHSQQNYTSIESIFNLAFLRFHQGRMVFLQWSRSFDQTGESKRDPMLQRYIQMKVQECYRHLHIGICRLRNKQTFYRVLDCLTTFHIYQTLQH